MAYNYWCSNRGNCPECEFCNVKGDLQSDQTGDLACPNKLDHPLKLMGQTVTGRIAPPMSKEKIKQDRSKRRTGDFQNNILPYLGRDEKRHFGAKGYKV